MVLRDPRVVTWLLNVYKHLKKDYDYLLIIAGDTGTGKSMFGLQLLETWYKVILKQEFDEKRVEQINSDYKNFLTKFQEIGKYDMNIYDEGGTALDSKDFMTKMSKDLSKLFNVFRAKRFFSVIILPNYFNLNKTFRENRLRGLVYISKRGTFKLFTKRQINNINAYFDNKSLKHLNRHKPIMIGSFSDYKGKLRKLYDKRKLQGIDDLLSETINNHQEASLKSKSKYELYGAAITKMRKQCKTYADIAKETGLASRTITRIISQLKENKKLWLKKSHFRNIYILIIT